MPLAQSHLHVQGGAQQFLQLLAAHVLDQASACIISTIQLPCTMQLTCSSVIGRGWSQVD